MLFDNVNGKQDIVLSKSEVQENRGLENTFPKSCDVMVKARGFALT